ncbi:MAG: peptidylprolyl isomerase [Planctomycetota bacterium]
MKHLIPLSVLLITFTATGAMAQSGLELSETVLNALRAEVSPVQHICSPNLPIRIRFTLHNLSDQTVEIPLRGVRTVDNGIALPLETILGVEESALSISYQDEKPVPIPTVTIPDIASGLSGILRLAPYGSVGTTIDLHAHYRKLSYSGEYRLEWRPLGGRLEMVSTRLRVEPRKEAILVTDKGKITFRLMYDEAPVNVENFLELTRAGFYDGKHIHRIIPGFLIQGGCPQGDGTGLRPDGKTIPAEFHNAPFRIGTLAMARKPTDPNSASCQFFVTLARLSELDSQYTVIGQADDEESLRTLNQLANEPTDRRDRPRIPLIIRSINLVDAEVNRVSRFDLKSASSTTSRSEHTSDSSPPKQP